MLYIAAVVVMLITVPGCTETQIIQQPSINKSTAIWDTDADSVQLYYLDNELTWQYYKTGKAVDSVAINVPALLFRIKAFLDNDIQYSKVVRE